MNIYEDGGDAIDIDRAAAEVRATGLIQNDGVRRYRLAEIQTAALVDIAGSLRVLASEAAAAMLPAASVEYFEGGEDGDDTEPDGPRDFLLVGDLVHLVGQTEPGEIVALGFDGEGAGTATVNFGDGDVRGPLYVTSLVRMVGDEGRDLELLDAMIEAGDDPAGEISDEEEAADPDLVDLDAEPGPEDLVDDIDADFGNEPHPEAESAVDVLRANEAARKAAKKAAAKKGSKK